jgi:hypothetical protein
MRMVQPSEAQAPLLVKKVFQRGRIYDQGQTGTCVGHGWRAWMDGEPLRTKGGPTPFELYDQFILADDFPDNDHDTARQMGTTVRAGAKVMTTLGRMQSYLWAFHLDDVRKWILSGQGGVVFGLNWYRQMSTPDAEGIIKIGGPLDGGHSFFGFGADDASGFVMIQNSWSEGWGGWHEHGKLVYRGCAKLPYEDLDRLLKEQGEACTAVEQSVKPKVPSTADKVIEAVFGSEQ